MTIKTSSGAVVPLRSSGLKPGNKKVLRAIPRSALRSGSYRVEWRGLAPDGHRQRGSWSFRVRR
jgi:methionine-rich copper-binding protein CopC